MENEQTSIRIKRGTLARLRAAVENIVAAVEAGTRPDPGLSAERINPAGQALSLDALINLLLDQRDAHLTRAKRARENTKRIKKIADDTLAATVADE